MIENSVLLTSNLDLCLRVNDEYSIYGIQICVMSTAAEDGHEDKDDGLGMTKDMATTSSVCRSHRKVARERSTR
jgi:hypothetical protein